MEKWLEAALAYVPEWLAFQLRISRQPGCAVAISHRDAIVMERAFGCADLASGEALAPRHRFRVASHSKSFTAAGILKLREAGRLRLDDRAGDFVEGLHASVAEVSVGQLLAHSGGLTRDGPDADQFQDRRPCPDTDELKRNLAEPSPIEPEQRLKYSNHGYALLGMIAETVTGEPYAAWIRREIVAAAGLQETEPDIEFVRNGPLAKGHSAEQPLGYRVVLPGHNPAGAITPAAGFTSTAADLARFFAQLAPHAERSVLSAASRREMVRRHWRAEDLSLERYYGLGIMSGASGPWDWFGHTGAWQGFISRTAVVPTQNLTVSVLTNAIDGLAQEWVEGILHILKRFAAGGAPAPATAGWTGRWWAISRATDLVPIGSRVLCAEPVMLLPFQDAAEIEVTSADEGRIVKAMAFRSFGEPARLLRDGKGGLAGVQLAGSRLIGEAELQQEMRERYGAISPGGARRKGS